MSVPRAYVPYRDGVIPEAYSTEVGLLAGAAAGDPEAVRAVLDSVAPAVYGFIYARVGGRQDVAEDLTQETIIEAVRSAHTFRGDAALRTWMCAIARRRLARFYESERKADIARSGLSVIDADHRDPVEQRDEIIRALGRLSALHRQVLVLKYLEEMSVEQIAAELGRTPIQIQSLLQRARVGLRRELEADRAGID